MKKSLSKEQKKERNIKIAKMVAYCVGLTLSAGAFISLLVIGVRGCATTPRSNESTQTTSRDPSDSQNRLVVDNNEGSHLCYYINERYTPTVGDLGSSYDAIDYRLPFRGYVIGDVEVSDDVYYERFEYIDVYYTRSSQGINCIFTINDGNPIWFDFGFRVLGNSVSYIVGDYRLKDNLLLFDEDYSYYLVSNSEVDNAGGFSAYLFNLYLECAGLYQPDYEIAFNNTINPYAVFGDQLNYFNHGDYTGRYLFFEGLFQTIDDGTLYDCMYVHVLTANGIRYGTETDYQVNSVDDTYHYVALSFYERSSEGRKQVIVNSQNYGIASSGSAAGNGVLLQGNYWRSAIFQNIRVLFSFNEPAFYGDTPTSSLNRKVVLTSLNNNVAGKIGIGATYHTGFGSIGGNPFDLIGSAFSALVPLLGVYLWPGVTIGLLLFIPLVASIVLFVVWLFKR